MSQDLGKRLITSGAVTEAALNEALQRQVVFGGSLDTNLLEVGAATEEVLLLALGEALALPTANREQIEQIGQHIPRLFPLVFAETYHLVPYNLVEQDLAVLVNAAPDDQLFTHIRERLRLRVSGVVTTEARLHYAMYRLYGTALQPRFANLLSRLDGRAPDSPGPENEHVLSWGLSNAVITPTAARGDDKRRGLDVRGLLSRVDAATDRDSVVEGLLSAALAVFDFAGLFAVHGDLINGWRGSSSEVTQRLARISLNVELPSVFQTIYVTGGHYLGPLPHNSINAKLLEDMGRGVPRAALLAPISVGGKLAAILYADNGARGVSSKRVAAVLLLAQRTGMAFERLIRRQKARADKGFVARVDDPESLEIGPITISAEGESWGVQERAAATPAAVADGVVPATVESPAAPTIASQTSSAASFSEAWGAMRLSEIESTDGEGADIGDEIVLEPEEVEAAAVDAAPTASSPTYTAFADVSDSPRAALDDWQDVLLETTGLERTGRPSSRRAQAAPPSVTWEDVIAEAEHAQNAMTAAAPVEVAGTVIDTRELLFDSLEAQSPEVRHDAVEKLLALGTSIDDELRSRFPGRLAFDPFAISSALPAFRACSGLLELIAARGVSAAPIVLPHLESPEAFRRFFAIYFLHAVAYPPALSALARRLYDAEPKNRFLAAETLRAYAGEPGYAHVVQSLRDQLRVPILESQVAAVQILGQLREPTAVPSLIPLVVAKRADLAGAAASALAVICGQAFGADVARWAEWWQNHYNRLRAAWLVESLRSPTLALVRLAHNELVLLSGRNVRFDFESAAGRESAIRDWEEWWSQAARSYLNRRQRP